MSEENTDPDTSTSEETTDPDTSTEDQIGDLEIAAPEESVPVAGAAPGAPQAASLGPRTFPQHYTLLLGFVFVFVGAISVWEREHVFGKDALVVCLQAVHARRGELAPVGVDQQHAEALCLQRLGNRAAPGVCPDQQHALGVWVGHAQPMRNQRRGDAVERDRADDDQKREGNQHARLRVSRALQPQGEHGADGRCHDAARGHHGAKRHFPAGQPGPDRRHQHGDRPHQHDENRKEPDESPELPPGWHSSEEERSHFRRDGLHAKKVLPAEPRRASERLAQDQRPVSCW